MLSGSAMRAESIERLPNLTRQTKDSSPNELKDGMFMRDADGRC